MNRPEQALQIALVAALRLALPKPWLVFHVRNQGEQRSKRAHGVLKAMGVLAGVPDLFVIGPSSIVAIELKAPPVRLKRGGVSRAKPIVSDAQCDVIAQLGQCGVPTLIVRDVDGAIAALTQLGVPLKARVMA